MKNVFVSGSFDLFHSGHVAFLKEASKYGKVFVGIGSDESINILKNRPTVNSQQERLFMVKAIRYVADAWINKGIGDMDFKDDFMHHGVNFGILLVNKDQDIQEKRDLCNMYNMDYIVLDRIPEEGLPARSSTSQRKYYD